MNSAYAIRMEPVLTHIDTHAGVEINLNQLAQLAGFSRFHFQRIFVGVVGQTPAAYLRRIRLENAHRLIAEHPNRSLTNISFDCGFSSSSLFSRSFRAEFGYAPRQVQQLLATGSIGLAARRSPPPIAKTSPPQEPIRPVQVGFSPTMRLAFIRCTGYGLGIGLAYARLFRTLRRAGLIGAWTKAVGISLDNPEITDPKQCRYYAGAIIPLQCPLPSGLATITLPEGRRAIVPYSGDLAGIDQAIAWLFRNWLPTSGFFPADLPLYSLIARNPFWGESSRYEMEICLPIE